ncbi:MAG: OmpA family protein [Bacteroidaceae bacterium]|nr:OmpA family protein [Bacteroidaceae bacterium]
MKGLKFYALGLCAALLMNSCGDTSNATKGGLIGGGSGAALGAALGALIASNSGKGAIIGGAAGAAVGTAAGILIGKKMDKAKAEAEKVANAQVTTTTDANGYEAVKVTFDSGILFQTGKSALSASAQSSLTNFAQNVLLQNTDMNVGIVGYTDNTPFKGKSAAESAAANQQLSLQRATAVSNYLKGKGVTNNQIKEVAGLGESNPVADNSTAAGKAQNRRVEVYLYASDEMIKQAQAGTLQ